MAKKTNYGEHGKKHGKNTKKHSKTLRNNTNTIIYNIKILFTKKTQLKHSYNTQQVVLSLSAAAFLLCSVSALPPQAIP